MLEKLKRVNALTLVVLLVALVALVMMVHNHWTPEQIAVVAGALMATTAQLDRLLRSSQETKTEPPQPPGAVILPFAVGVGLVLVPSACAPMDPQARAAVAESEYTHELARCVEAEPTPRSDEERRAAWARVDTCRAKVRERWGIVETVTTKDGGR